MSETYRCIRCSKAEDGERGMPHSWLEQGGAILASRGPVCSTACRLEVLRRDAKEQDPNWTPGVYDPYLAGKYQPAEIEQRDYLDIEGEPGKLTSVAKFDHTPTCQVCSGVLVDDDPRPGRRPVKILGTLKVHAGCAEKGISRNRMPAPRTFFDMAKAATEAGERFGRDLLTRAGILR